MMQGMRGYGDMDEFNREGRENVERGMIVSD